VNAREVAGVLSDRSGMRHPATSHAAGANLRRLRTAGHAEAKQADGWAWWRPTDAGVAAAAEAE